MKKGFFITGTDTGVGKTMVTAGLIRALQKAGYSAMPVKPLASGAVLTEAGLCNEDGVLLKNSTTLTCDYHIVNPIALSKVVAPHIAAKEENISLSVEKLLAACSKSFAVEADYYCVEGAGGWLVPLNEKETLADFATVLQWPIIIVVGMKLGCLNHGALTHHMITQSGLTIAGWVANVIDPDMLCLQENIHTLISRLPSPLLGVIPYAPEDPILAASTALSLHHLM